MAAAIAQMLPLILSIAAGAASGLGGSKAEKGSTFNPQQLSTIDNILKQIKGGAPDVNQNQNFQTGQDYLQSVFNDPSFFQRFEAPLQRQFNEEIVPGLANRFASMGSGGSLGSTGFRNQLAREGSNLSTNIASLRGQMQQNAVPQLLSYSQQPFSNYMSLLNQALQPTQNTYTPPNAGFFGNIAPSLIGGISQGFGQQYGQQIAQRFPGQSSSTV